MKELPEYVGKDQLQAVGVPVPDGSVITGSDINGLNTPAVVKAQVGVSGRGNKGGIVFCDSIDDLRSAVDSMLGESIDGHQIESVLVEEVIDPDEELYIGIMADGSEELPTFLLSHRGGQDIETVPEKYIASIEINPLTGLQPYHLRTAANKLTNVDPQAELIPVEELVQLLNPIWMLFVKSDLKLLEINPVGLVDGGPIAMDAKLIIDEAAEFRQEYIATHSSLTDLEHEANERGLELKEGNGRIAIMANGAGIGLSTLDLLSEVTDEQLASFIDTHGPQFSVKQTRDCLELMAQSGASLIIVNMVTPFLDSSKVAEELVAAVKNGYDLPIVARFKGLGADQARERCTSAGIIAVREVPEAIQRVGELLKEGQ